MHNMLIEYFFLHTYYKHFNKDFIFFRQEGMETGSEGEVTNNDFPLRKTGEQLK